MAKKKQAELEEEVIYEDVELDESEESEDSSIGSLFEKNQRLISAIGLGVILLIAAIFAYNYYQGQQNIEANREMFQAVYYFEADSFNQALNGDGQYLGFLDIADMYSGTEAADMANYYIGLIYLNSGTPQIDLGIDYLEKVPLSNTMMGMARNTALAFAYEEQNEPEKAARLFEKASRIPGENDQTTPTMLFHAARNYEAANDLNKALSLYQEIKDEYPLSTEGLTIDKYIARVSN